MVASSSNINVMSRIAQGATAHGGFVLDMTLMLDEEATMGSRVEAFGGHGVAKVGEGAG